MRIGNPSHCARRENRHGICSNDGMAGLGLARRPTPFNVVRSTRLDYCYESGRDYADEAHTSVKFSDVQAQGHFNVIKD